MPHSVWKTFLLMLFTAICSPAVSAETAPERKSPLDTLPPYIKRVTHFGQRADWSHDGKRILFLSKTFGDVYEVELATGVIRPVTHHFFHEGFTRRCILPMEISCSREPANLTRQIRGRAAMKAMPSSGCSRVTSRRRRRPWASIAAKGLRCLEKTCALPGLRAAPSIRRML